MNNLAQLIQNRLDQLDADRRRQQERERFVYIGNITPNAIAHAPMQGVNVVVIRESDPLPAKHQFHAYSMWELRGEWINRTRPNGRSLRCWLDAEE